ncbi:glycine receptor subunit alpha-4-like [Tigriopus californicus]|uniref:glycine receptor subunit alpha-4-like n=1 Tax=Tigriopus californicus TaxID=6832 RepID=UPI0027DA3E53|nr:glycine receptor subunit alpha-4-like [Tigriopus californicus]
MAIKKTYSSCIPFWSVLLFVTLASDRGNANEGSDLDNPLELGDIMPQNRKLYDKMRPPKYKGNATEVNFHVTVMSLDTIDESSMTYTCDVFFAQSWKDNRLRLPDNMTSEYRLLPIEWLTEIWRPDSFFKNAKSVTFQTMTIPNHYIWLWKDKTILYMVKLTLVLSCPMHFNNYPHDTQTCNLEIESISHTTDDLIFIWDPQIPLDVDKGIELPQLELISTKNDDCTTEYSTGKFTCLEVVFMFKRRLGYYLFHTYVPTCLIVIMSWISFWIKPEAVPARVTLGVTSLLTLSTQHANSQKSLPPVSYIKAIDVFMSGCTVFVFLSLMEYALVNIVMGDIADIEKKKSMGISNLILGTRGIQLPKRDREFPCDADGNVQLSMVNDHQPDRRSERKYGDGFLKEGDPLENNYDVTSHLLSSQECVHSRSRSRSGDMIYEIPKERHHMSTKQMESELGVNGDSTSHHHHPSRLLHPAELGRYPSSVGGPMTQASNLPPPPPPPPINNHLATVSSNVLSQQGIKSLVHDVQMKRQKEIRDMMKKKREKAVLVDRISRWLFPTSFILLNIVYWALFGDHDLW